MEGPRNMFGGWEGPGCEGHGEKGVGAVKTLTLSRGQLDLQPAFMI